MVSRSKRKGNYHRYDVRSLPVAMADFQRSYKSPSFRARPAGRVVSIKTYLPLSVALRARNKIYTYKYPSQMRKKGRVIRLPLKSYSKALERHGVRKGRSRRVMNQMVPVKVRIRLPRMLPEVYGSYVSLARDTLNIHSHNQLRRVIDAQEFNRRRYSEYKGNHRKARHGQLDSRGARRFGAVAETYRRGGSIDAIADAALVARSIS